MAGETVASYVYRTLTDAGVGLIIGLPGTQTLPIDHEIARHDDLDYVMARHETAIPHIAWGYYEVNRRPAATVTVPGPGETNAMHGLKNALEDCVPIIHLTGDAAPDEFGKKPIHEIDPGTYDAVVKENVVVSSIDSLAEAVTEGIETALSAPYGPVRLGIPASFYDQQLEIGARPVEPTERDQDDESAIDRATDLLAGAQRPLCLVGGGVARSPGGPEAVRRFARAFDLPVVTTYKGKGVFPADDDRYVGAAGGSLPPGGVNALEAADVVLALGTDFDGICTNHWSLPMGDTRIHVTLDPSLLDASYPATVGLVGDAGRTVQSLHTRLADRASPDRWSGAELGRQIRREYDRHLEAAGLLADGPPLHTPALLRTVRETIPDDTIVVTDVGGFRLWAMQTFRVFDHSRFVTAGSWAGMGVGLPAAIGAALGEPDTPVVCITGDGGLLMCLQELATAVEQNLDLVLVVANNSDYGIISQRFDGSHPRGDPPFGWASPDFSAIAAGFGWQTAAVEEAASLRGSLARAVERDDPTVIDVAVPANEPTANEAATFESSITFDS